MPLNGVLITSSKLIHNLMFFGDRYELTVLTIADNLNVYLIFSLLPQLYVYLRNIKFGHLKSGNLWLQVGDGDSDHYCWERAEDMTTPRTAYKLDTEHPGSDLAGETAAAMAAASMAFRPYNSSYSDLLLVHAKQVGMESCTPITFRVVD